ADGTLAVIGVLMEAGADNLALSEFWNLIPAKRGETRREKRVLVNARDLLPHDRGYYRYMGSLTTPPCTEGVNWYVMATPVQVGAGQVARFARVIGQNARPLQAVRNRLVLAPAN
ncbi:MAG: carbonic anhydrase family protein, partial [Kiloniellaceae bacterium]